MLCTRRWRELDYIHSTQLLSKSFDALLMYFMQLSTNLGKRLISNAQPSITTARRFAQLWFWLSKTLWATLGPIPHPRDKLASPRLAPPTSSQAWHLQAPPPATLGMPRYVCVRVLYFGGKRARFHQCWSRYFNRTFFAIRENVVL